ncbi:MAG: DUF2207 domain-containing protein [Cryobacterium sp.]|nr:DUF2207 domain-containing protein [Cryobacterium sp.]
MAGLRRSHRLTCVIARKLAAIALATGIALALTACDDSASANLDDFYFESFSSDFYLELDENDRSMLTTKETLVAVFPEVDQNRGIRRQLVTTYDGHPTQLRVVSVTDENGVPRHYESENLDDSDVLELTIRDSTFVHGRHTYVITYTQRDVTRFFEDTGVDEFYWDVNGTGWRQPFGIVTARVHLAEELRSRMTGGIGAYSGYAGEQGPATIRDVGGVLEIQAVDLRPRQNLSFAIGFEAGTFTGRDSSFTASVWPGLSVGATGVALVTMIWAFTVRRRRLRDEPGRPVVVAEYLPPEDGTILVSSILAGASGKATTAMLLHLAVSGNLRIVEEGGKGKYRLDFLSEEGLDVDERGMLRAIFGSSGRPGSTRRLTSNDEAAAKRIAEVVKSAKAAMVAEGYRRPYPAGSTVPPMLVAAVAGIAAFVFGAIGLDLAFGGPWAIVMLLAPVFMLVTWAVLAKIALTAKGAEHRDHLRGLKEYIRLAEQDRLNYLQSPQGALRTPVATGDRHELIRLNERLLPYAVLFRQEKKWAAELGKYYEDLGESPSWYSGTTVFSAAALSSSIGGIGSTVASSFSSSSGGSSGGGGSGGGGGGGGGGGA